MFLHPTTVYGPLKSRRLGTSLGINLLPNKRKVCNFECIYCECGWTDSSTKDPLPTVDSFALELESKLKTLRDNNVQLSHITFAGNGEPTMHPAFSEIVSKTVALRDRWSPSARIAILSNSTMLAKSSVREAIRTLDEAILKLDAGTEAMFRLIDQPSEGTTLDQITDELVKLEMKVIIQTLLLRGWYGGKRVDNTTEIEISAWIERLLRIKPEKVMLYTIDRETPAENLEKVPVIELQAIVSRLQLLGIAAESYA